MRVPYVQPEIGPPDAVLPDIERILASGRLTKGDFVRQYEEALAERLGVDHVVATASCTTGLALLYRALGLQGKVIVPSFTFMATVHALVWAGGTPVFVDVNEATFAIDPEAVNQAMTPEVVGIVGVPVFGVPCETDALEEIAQRHGVPLVFDSAHGIGSYENGRPLGGNGRAEVFSTTPTKTLVTGEGGFVTTNDPSLAQQVSTLVEYGNDGSFDCHLPGLNGRLSEIHAAIGLRGVERLDETLARRQQLAAEYRGALELIGGIRCQHVPDGCVSSFKDFTIVVEDDFPLTRDQLREFLASRDVETRAYFCPVVHRQQYYLPLGYDGKLPVTESLEQRVLSLPIWSNMRAEQSAAVLDAIQDAATQRAQGRRTSRA